MSTKKTVDTEIVEDVDKIEPEVVEEVKEPVVDEVKEIVPEVKAPLRGISTPSMIHTHLDNFLAKLCGETPVDDKVRNSLEFWINELAKGNGGSTKKIYWHNVQLSRTRTAGGETTITDAIIIVLNNNSDAFTLDDFDALIKTAGVIIPCIGGTLARYVSGVLQNYQIVKWVGYAGYEDVFTISLFYPATGETIVQSYTYVKSEFTITDLGVNPIN